MGTDDQVDSSAAPSAIAFPAPPPGFAPDTPPRCLGCGYELRGLEQPRCPECGRRFDPNDPHSFTWRPPFLFWTYWLPGLVMAAVLGFLLLAGFVLAGSYGYGLIVGVPVAIGVILGYGVRVKWFVFVLLALTVVSALVFAAMSADLSGVFCGLILGAIFLGPMVFGTFLGWAMRQIVKSTRFSQRSYLPIIAALLLPVGIAGVEKMVRSPAPIEVVTTSRVLPVSPQRAWDSLMFYEDVKHDPPWQARFGLPHPLRAVGHIGGVGDTRTCIYSKGRLVKRVTEYKPAEHLGFDVIEQTNIENRSIRLLRGSFHFEALDADHTRVTLTTVYEPLLQARAVWRLLEYPTAHALHEHVLEGMALEAQRRQAAAEATARKTGEAQTAAEAEQP